MLQAMTKTNIIDKNNSSNKKKTTTKANSCRSDRISGTTLQSLSITMPFNERFNNHGGVGYDSSNNYYDDGARTFAELRSEHQTRPQNRIANICKVFYAVGFVISYLS